jgi:hypothetical protein
MKDETNRFTPWAIVKGFFYVIGLAAMVYAFNAFLDAKIEKRLNDPLVTRRIAKLIRPFAIFSGTGTILVDNGAMEYVADLRIQSNGTSRIPEKVILVPKRYMAHAPLITAIDQVGAVARPTRGSGLTWEYTFDAAYIMEPGIGPEKKTTAQDDRYRMEIIE